MPSIYWTVTIVGIGDETCRFSPRLIRDGPAVLAIPTGRGDTDPELIAAAPRGLIARATSGFDIPETADPLTATDSAIAAEGSA